jgi:hypothetical protein
MAGLGFEVLSRGRDGSVRYGRRSHPYLVWWLTAWPNGMAELTWELSLGQYLRDKGFAVTGQDELSLLVFPREESRGPFDPEWVAAAVKRAEDALASLDFVAGT